MNSAKVTLKWSIASPQTSRSWKKLKGELLSLQEDKKLAAVPTNLFSHPHAVKARLLINAHMERVALPATTLETDRQYIVRKTPMLLQEMINLFVKLLYLYFQGRALNRVKLSALENMMWLHQFFVQRIGEGKSPLLQLPHLRESQLKAMSIKRREIKSLENLAKIPNKEKEVLLNFMEQQGYQDLLNVLGLLPVITIDVDTQVIDDRNQTKITAHSIVAVRCTLTRDCFKNVHFPQDTKFYGNGMTTYTVKLARAKLPANACNFTCSSQVKRSHTQFTCVTCNLPVNTGKFTCFEAASTSRRIHTNCLQAHVNLPDYHRQFTGSFTCGTHANLLATNMQNCLILLAKTLESEVKIPTRRRQK